MDDDPNAPNMIPVTNPLRSGKYLTPILIGVKYSSPLMLP